MLAFPFIADLFVLLKSCFKMSIHLESNSMSNYHTWLHFETNRYTKFNNLIFGPKSKEILDKIGKILHRKDVGNINVLSKQLVNYRITKLFTNENLAKEDVSTFFQILTHSAKL